MEGEIEKPQILRHFILEDNLAEIQKQQLEKSGQTLTTSWMLKVQLESKKKQ